MLRNMTHALLLLFIAVVPVRAEIAVGFLMDLDPQIQVPPPVCRISPELKSLWLEALARTEADMQRLAADAIQRAHALGMADFPEAIPRLEAVLTSAASHPSARLAAARALVELDARTSAEPLATSARQFGADLRQVIEPALARWDYRPMREVWRARLKEPQPRHRELMLALRCLTAAGDESAAADFLEFAHNARMPLDARIECARDAGLLVDRGLEANARSLLAGKKSASMANRLCSVQLVARHSGHEAVGLLKEFAVDAEPAIAAIALARLIEIDPQLASPLAERAIGNADAKVRELGAQACALVPDVSRVAILARLLNDPHPELRRSVCQWLRELSHAPELDESIRRLTTEILAGDDWRGLEQAALLLAALDHKPAAQRLVDLIDHRRAEVRVAAAWGAKMLAVPETLPSLLNAALRRTELRMGQVPPPEDLDAQTAHLLELFGKVKYHDAEPLLKRYIPKEMQMGELSRTAAIWSLGHLHAGVPDEGLARQFAERLADFVAVPVEMTMVRAMSAVSIGRMKAVSQASTLRGFLAPPIVADELSLRIRWGLMELTGESIAEPEPATIGSGRWFLQSIDR